MRHTVLFQLKPHVDLAQFYTIYEIALAKIEQELPFVSQAKVYQNQLQDAGNYDLMVTFVIDSLAQLPDYATCPTHQQLIQDTCAGVANICRFDSQEAPYV